MAQARIYIHIAWWVMPYLYGVRALSMLTGMEPDIDKVMYWGERGLSVNVDTHA